MQNDYSWLLKKTPRSVSNLHLWDTNPRLDPDNSYSYLKEVVEEMILGNTDRIDFIDLAKSMVEKGFIPADPVVIWQDPETKKFFVAEGNRRIAVLKLLLEPQKAPKSIKNIFTKLSSEIDKRRFEKVPVSVAPSFEDAEWYISQRNSTSSLQKRWSREQQQRWVANLYEKYRGDIEIIKAQAGVEEAELENILRTLKIKALVYEVKDQLTESEFVSASSHRFPISTLERFFGTKKVRDEWGLEPHGPNIKITKDRSSFLNSYAQLIKAMLLPTTDPNRVDSRTITDNLDTILETLPKVEEIKDEDKVLLGSEMDANNLIQSGTDDQEQSTTEENIEQPKKALKNDPNRARLILECYHLDTDNFRLLDMFNELKTIPLKYKNSVAASIRIFLDLGVLVYLEKEDLIKDVEAFGKTTIRLITLSRRIEFLKTHLKSNLKVSGILQKLLNPANELSLDVLNGYIHNNDVHYLNQAFLNKFWDFLFPFFSEILDIKEKQL